MNSSWDYIIVLSFEKEKVSHFIVSTTFLKRTKSLYLHINLLKPIKKNLWILRNILYEIDGETITYLELKSSTIKIPRGVDTR